jgi:hypothetical protein
VDREGLAGRIPRGAARVAGRRRGFSAPAGDATNARSNVIRACASRSIAGVASFDPYTVESSRLWSSDRNTTILGFCACAIPVSVTLKTNAVRIALMFDYFRFGRVARQQAREGSTFD